MLKKEKKIKEKIPFAQKHPRLNFVFSLLILLGMLLFSIWILYLVIHMVINGITNLVNWSRQTLSNLDTVVVVALITGSVSLVSVLFTSVISKIIEYKQKRLDYLNQKREKSYGQFVDMYFKIHENTKGISKYSEENMINDMMEFSRELTLWGSNSVVKKWIDFRLNGDKKGENSIYLIEKILFAMRKDMGFKNMRKGTLLKMTINDYDEHVKKKIHKNQE